VRLRGAADTKTSPTAACGGSKLSPVSFYAVGLGILLVVACLDLVVGVANDAVNFLNSAVGARAGSLRVLLWIASAGVILGVFMSSGMMEVARSGIFVPGHFTFHEVMVIFLAVMVTDVILLDLFNTLGLPTSTTVSLVFELLGAATVMALIATAGRDQPISAVADYINGASALRIITGIVLSVVIAFSAGLVAQWVFRLLFTFDLVRISPWMKRVWSGVALSAIGVFLVMKGLKGADVVPAGATDLFAAWPVVGFLVAVLVATGIATLLEKVARLDPLRATVLAGTFALATAFASNDLVNFIGVPLAGLTAHQAWSASGQLPDDLKMDALAAPVVGQTGLIFLAGIIMVFTLHLSQKARSVTETEVSLGRQSVGVERFKPGVVSRALVGLWLWVDDLVKALMPARLAGVLEARFALPEVGDDDRPAFDMLRASVNLAVSSGLIVMATMEKLPLSTTFVTFMVAMGSSLADRSWGRDSAVYRVAGVGHVLGGWFATAALAALTAGLLALVLWMLGGVGLGAITALAVASLVLSTRWHRRRTARIAAQRVERYVQPERLAGFLHQAAEGLRGAVAALEEPGMHRRRMEAARQEADVVRGLEGQVLRFAQTRSVGDRMKVVRLYRHERDLIEAVAGIAEQVQEHHANLHTPLDPDQQRHALMALGTAVKVLSAAEAQAARPAPVDPAPLGIPSARRAIQEAVQEELGAMDPGLPDRASRLVVAILRECDRVLAALEEVLELSGQLFPRAPSPPRVAPPRSNAPPPFLSPEGVASPPA
jgi:phosphate/sulfate permease